MPILQIDYDVGDFEAWRRSFESGWLLCAARNRGLRAHRVLRAPATPSHVRVELEFHRLDDAQAVHAALAELSGTGLGGSAGLTSDVLHADRGKGPAEAGPLLSRVVCLVG